MKMFKKFAAWFATIFLSATLMTAWAADPVIEKAKADNVIGEMYDGYLGVVDASRVTPDLQRRLDEINSGRLARYTEISRSSGVDVGQVGVGMAEKLFERAKPGESLKAGKDAPWRKKP